MQVQGQLRSQRAASLLHGVVIRSVHFCRLRFPLQCRPERVLYGTDTPLYLAAMQRARIDHADLSDRDKQLILRDNATQLFRLPPS